MDGMFRVWWYRPDLGIWYHGDLTPFDASLAAATTNANCWCVTLSEVRSLDNEVIVSLNWK